MRQQVPVHKSKIHEECEPNWNWKPIFTHGQQVRLL